ncbi:MAG: polysaccharide biosynthesis protein [Clostridia bacterium]|nr:polysaccharide biosynthesis protein [Clostridia bacterium]
MSDKQKSIVGGMTILGLSGFICKVVGALYKIPLAWIIGDSGLGIYQMVFSTYNLLLTVSSSGIPVAISRLVSYSLAKDDPRNAKRIFRIALSLLMLLGFVSMLLMLVFNPVLARRVGDPQTGMGFMAIAPALLLVCVMSAFRGFMQGQQNMAPTAISQLIEQVGKVAIILPLAYVGMKISLAHAAAFVLLGNTLAEAAAVLFIFIVYRRNRKVFERRRQNEEMPSQSDKSLLRQILSFAIPITLGSCVIPMAGFIDSGMLLNRLMDTGMALDDARALYGRYSGFVISLINVPTALSIAIAMSLVPAISSAIARGDRQAMERQCNMGIRYAFLIGLPCSIGMSVLSARLLAMIYPFSSPDALRVTAELLSLSSLTIVLFTVTQSTGGILQGMRKQRIPMYTLVAGVAVKVLLNYLLVGTPSVNIYGAPMASIACYTIAMVPNLYFTYKHARIKMDGIATVGKPLLATACMGILLYAGNRHLPQGTHWTLLLILAGIASYAAFALWTGAMTREDLLPFARRFRRKGGNS